MATKYAITGGGEWGGATWATASNQSESDTTYPEFGDTAILDQYSGDVSVNADVGCDAIDCTGYTGTLTMNALMMTLGNVTLSAFMTFNPNTYAWEQRGGGNFESAGKSFYDFTVFASGAGDDFTVTLMGTLTVTNLFTIEANKQVTLDGYMGTSNVYCQGSLTVGGDDSIIGTAVIQLTGTGTWASSIAQFDCDVVINTSGTITLDNASDIVIGGNFTHTAGTVVATGTTIQINGAGKNFDSNGITWNNITIPPPGDGPTLLSNMRIDGDFVCGRAFHCGTYTITLKGDFTDSNTDGTQIIDGNCTWVFDGTTVFASTNGYHPAFYNMTINAGKTVTLKASSTINVANQFVAAGTSGSHITLNSDTPSTSAVFKPVVLGVISYVDATDIDSTGVGEVATAGGSLTRTTNWVLSLVLKMNALARSLIKTVGESAATAVKTVNATAFR